MDFNLDALANAIIEEYKQHTGDEKLVESFISSVGASGTYSDVYKLAKKAGLNLEQAIIDKWTFGADEVYFSTMKDLLKKTAGPMHDDIARACLFIQDKMNKAAGIKLKSQFAPLNEYDLGDIAERMKNQGITKLMGELQTLGCKMVDDNQQANMELQTSAGYEIVVSRKYDSIGLRSGTKYAERCKICVGLEGTHQFKSTREARSSGVFARHPGCGCVIDYYSKRTGRTDYNIQNYNNAKVSEDKKITKNEEVAKNLQKLDKHSQWIESEEYVELMRKKDSSEIGGNKSLLVKRNTFQYDAMENPILGSPELKIDIEPLYAGKIYEKVENSAFDIIVDSQLYEKEKVAGLIDDILTKTHKDFGTQIPQIRIVDMMNSMLNNWDGIAFYNYSDRTIYWNGFYRTTEMVQEYVTRHKGLFANVEIEGPIKHEMGHKILDDMIIDYALKSQVGYDVAKSTALNTINTFVSLKSKENNYFLLDQLSQYAYYGYKVEGKPSEVFAEAYSVKDKNAIWDELLKFMRGVKLI